MVRRYRHPLSKFAMAVGLIASSSGTSMLESRVAADEGGFIAPAVVSARRADVKVGAKNDLHQSLVELNENGEQQSVEPSAELPAKTIEDAKPIAEAVVPAPEKPVPVPPINEPDADEFIATDEQPAIDESTGTEVIHERFPNRNVKIERHVAQDAEGNYFNHGTWTQWDEQGRMIARGEFKNGKRDGKWFRWYEAKQGTLFADPANKTFERPFSTEAEFTNGTLDGVWMVYDAKHRPVCAWQFEDGQRHGRSVWYAPTGQVHQEVNFQGGQMHGDLRQLTAEGKMIVREKYIDGHRLAMEVKHYAPGKKKSEGEMLYAQTYTDVSYDWWTGAAHVTPPPKGSPNQRHGHWTWWFANGQKQMEGRYENDQPIGKFTWWFANGQRQLEGEYVGGQQHGKFVWWYDSGQKQRIGGYSMGVPVDNWMEWTTEGKVVQTEEYKLNHENVTPKPPTELATPAAEEKTPVRVGGNKNLRR